MPSYDYMTVWMGFIRYTFVIFCWRYLLYIFISTYRINSQSACFAEWQSEWILTRFYWLGLFEGRLEVVPLKESNCNLGIGKQSRIFGGVPLPFIWKLDFFSLFSSTLSPTVLCCPDHHCFSCWVWKSSGGRSTERKVKLYWGIRTQESSSLCLSFSLGTKAVLADQHGLWLLVINIADQHNCCSQTNHLYLNIHVFLSIFQPAVNIFKHD